MSYPGLCTAHQSSYPDEGDYGGNCPVLSMEPEVTA